MPFRLLQPALPIRTMARKSPHKTNARGGPRPAPREGAENPAIAALARRHAEAALAALIEVVGDCTASPAARISAASTLLNWGFGKAAPAGDDDNGPAELVIRWCSAQDGPASKPKRRPGPKAK